ncbi:hypothetical protein [Streptomyces chartreusis]
MPAIYEAPTTVLDVMTAASAWQARLSWDVKRDVRDEIVGKTVQAILPVG